MTKHPECEYNPDDPCLQCFPFRHAADGCPTSERCPGIDQCPDCQDVLAQAADSLGPGTYHGLDGTRHDLIVGKDGTFTALEEA